MERWRGQVVVITGASGGIGAYAVETLVRAGLKVVGLARRLDVLENMGYRFLENQTGKFYPIKCDLTKEEEIHAAFKLIEEKIGPVHVLINNAGCIVSERIIDGDMENIRKIFDVNVLGSMICIRDAVKSMRKNNVKGHIINMNSMAGHDAARIKVPVSAYCASKYAITGLTETVRNELSSVRSGIKITSISPGPVRTEMIREVGIPDELLDRVPILHRKDVVDAIVFALSTPAQVEVNELMITPLE